MFLLVFLKKHFVKYVEVKDLVIVCTTRIINKINKTGLLL